MNAKFKFTIGLVLLMLFMLYIIPSINTGVSPTWVDVDNLSSVVIGSMFFLTLILLDSARKP